MVRMFPPSSSGSGLSLTFEVGDRVLDFVREVKHAVDERVQQRVKQIRRAPFADFPRIFRDAPLDVLEDEFPLFVKGNQEVRSRDEGNLLPARLELLDAEPHGARDGENHLAVFLEFRPGPFRDDVLLRQHRDVEKRADDVDELRVLHPHHLHPDDAGTVDEIREPVDVGELVEGIA